MLKFFTKIASFSPIYRYKISGNSMSPTLHDGQTILVSRLAYVFARAKIGDIVALYDPRDGKVLIKRIVKIKKSRYFVEGDNKNSSTDSRVFGMIGRQTIVGKLWQF